MCFFFSSRRRHTRWTGDWSSDVCSSDLTPIISAPGGHIQLAHTVKNRGAVSTGNSSTVAFFLSSDVALDGDDVAIGTPRAVQIGRASCRERGESSGGGGSIKKKKTTTRR